MKKLILTLKDNQELNRIEALAHIVFVSTITNIVIVEVDAENIDAVLMLSEIERYEYDKQCQFL